MTTSIVRLSARVQATLPQHAHVHEALQQGERDGGRGSCQDRVGLLHILRPDCIVEPRVKTG